MKTILVEPAALEVNGTVIGTVTQVTINGSIELGGTSGSAWVNLSGNNVSLANKSIAIADGISEAGADWALIEADVLAQLGLTKAANQNASPTPAPTQP